PQGNPVQDARVGKSLILTSGAKIEGWRHFVARQKLPRTDAGGYFDLPPMHAGSQIAVFAYKDGSAGVWSDRVTLGTSGPFTLPDLILAPGAAEIAGRVVDASGEPVDDAVVTLLDLGPPPTATDSEGRFHFSRIGKREYPMNVTSEHGRWYGKVEANTLELEVKLSPDY
ncbi:hypothetical protein LCGC14_2528230, partial [marine sediment metagenome]